MPGGRVETAGSDGTGSEPSDGDTGPEHGAPRPPRVRGGSGRDFLHVVIVILAVLALGAVLNASSDSCDSPSAACVDP